MAFYWGGTKLSWMRYLTLLSFRKLNPDWEMIVYHSKTHPHRSWKSWERMDSIDFKGSDYTYLIKKLGLEHREIEIPIASPSPTFASDLCSYEYMGTVGGWYADMDVLWVKPMSAIEHLTKDAGAVLCLTENVMGIGFLAGEPGCRLWHGVHATALRNYSPQEYQSCGVLAMHLHLKDIPTTQKMYPSVNVIQVPTETVYPWSAKQVKQIFFQTHKVPESCIGIHWFGGHPKSQIMNNQLTSRNMNRFKCTFTRYAKDITHSEHLKKLL